MPSFSLVIEYLTGYAVATDPSSREEPEWPPHPARVFMALAAAHFETDDTPAQKDLERDALNWLSELDPPDVTVPEATRRDALTTYVPVNDQGAGEALLRRSPSRVFFLACMSERNHYSKLGESKATATPIGISSR